MKLDQIHEALNEVFQDIFDDETLTVTATTTADDIEDWDSLAHINLILAVEKMFHLKFTMGEITEMKNVGQMIKIILERGSL